MIVRVGGETVTSCCKCEVRKCTDVLSKVDNTSEVDVHIVSAQDWKCGICFIRTLFIKQFVQEGKSRRAELVLMNAKMQIPRSEK